MLALTSTIIASVLLIFGLITADHKVGGPWVIASALFFILAHLQGAST